MSVSLMPLIAKATAVSGNHCHGLHCVLTCTYLCSSAVKQGEVIHSQIVVGTPGTVFRLIIKKALDLSKIALFVLDEADIMVSTEGYKVTQILKWADLVLCSTHHAAQLTSPCFIPIPLELSAHIAKWLYSRIPTMKMPCSVHCQLSYSLASYC